MVEPDTLGPELRIRIYSPGDRDALVALWDRCGLLVSYNNPDRDIALWRASSNAEIFVGEQDGKIVGTTGTAGIRTTSPSIRRPGKVAWGGA